MRLQHARGPVLHVVRHRSIRKFREHLEKQLAGTDARHVPDLTVAMEPAWHNNIGHALYDYAWPAFLGREQLGINRTVRFHTLLHIPRRLYGDSGPVYERERAHERIFQTIGGGELFITNELARPHVFHDVVLGHGLVTDEEDMNVNFTLAGGRGLDGARRFRDALYTAFGVDIPPHRKRSDQSRDGGVGRGLLVENPTHRVVHPWASIAVARARTFGVNLSVVNWNAHIPPGPDRLREHLRILSTADIYISGPGTAPASCISNYYRMVLC